MADKTDDELKRYYDKFSKKMKDLKYVMQLSDYSSKEHAFFGDEAFLRSVLNAMSIRLSNHSTWLSMAISQPATYEHMLTYKCLKDREKLGDAKKLVEDTMALYLDIDLTLLDPKADSEHMIDAYNRNIDKFFALSKEYISIIETVQEGIKKETGKNEKDVYIG